MRAKTPLIASALLLLFATFPEIGSADMIQPASLQPATASETLMLQGYSTSFSGFGVQNNSYSYPMLCPDCTTTQLATSSAHASGGSDPIVEAGESLSGQENLLDRPGPIGSSANVTYFFSVNGPAGATVPIIVSSEASADASTNLGAGLPSGFGAGASLFITHQTGSTYTPFYDAIVCAGNATNLVNSQCNTAVNAPDFFNVSQTLEVQPNDIYQVSLNAETTLLNIPLPNRSGGNNYTAGAGLDPTIVLAPGVGSDYSISFSPGLTSVPEPNYFALTVALTGVLLLTKRIVHS